MSNRKNEHSEIGLPKILKLVVAIDGGAACGKTTLGKTIATRCGLTFVDSGLIYRWIALRAVQAGVEIDDDVLIAKVARSAVEELEYESKPGLPLFDEGIVAALLQPEVTTATMAVARVGEVRQLVTATLRHIASQQELVVTGRDIATCVFPNADLKLFLEASLDVRARRRLLDERARGRGITLEEVAEELNARDQQDRERRIGPLVKDQGYVVIDTSYLSADRVANHAIELLQIARKH